ncbi:DUF2437 domain-containing protein [Streptomyces somaliensis]|uniref:Rv2993c-like domain-containing protein n=1 Tax=Streptomyces somaliensis TaxID=78355 RepID=UPI0020CDB23A|nr:Rv2993c-like domain-containing protein [Streptomyces somaliensis]MCP9944979.1 DUF2437 domain-containing protein [Streptomyces somaliensis]MCP9961798.1 DUF2437 domain-containing protein [Streptomyces somaliensis]MCP9974618.1 DUF2437 domain-containing protein [Streptomyces somaliensis]
MRVVRFREADTARYGALRDGGAAPPAAGPSGDPSVPDGVLRLPLSEVRLSAPVVPGGVLAAGRNHTEHAAEPGDGVPEVPLVFPGSATGAVGSRP